MKTILHLLSAILVCITFTCQAKTRSAMVFDGAKLMTVAKRDRLHYFTPVPKVTSRASALAVVPFYSHVVEFDTVESVNALGVDETTDFRSWRTVYQETPGLWIGLGHKRIPFQTVNQNAYWRAWCRNEP